MPPQAFSTPVRKVSEGPHFALCGEHPTDRSHLVLIASFGKRALLRRFLRAHAESHPARRQIACGYFFIITNAGFVVSYSENEMSDFDCERSTDACDGSPKSCFQTCQQCGNARLNVFGIKIGES